MVKPKRRVMFLVRTFYFIEYVILLYGCVRNFMTDNYIAPVTFNSPALIQCNINASMGI